MNKEKVSLIIPVFNVEQYICRCLDNCIHQSFTNIEIIIVDDNSSDRSSEKISKYIRKDSRIKYIRLDCNRGVSAARNIALNEAIGDYIVFVDSDDFLQIDAIENMIKLIRKLDTNLVIGSWQKTRLGIVVDKNINININIKIENLNSNNFILIDTCLSTVWGKLYKSNIINSNKLRFNEQVSIGEDHLFNLEYLLHCKLITLSNKIFYNYSLGGNLSTVKYQDDFNRSYKILLNTYIIIMTQLKINIPLSKYAAIFFRESIQHYILHSNKCDLIHKLNESYDIFIPYIHQSNCNILREIGFGNNEIHSLIHGEFYQFVYLYKRKRLIHIFKKRLLIFLRSMR